MNALLGSEGERGRFTSNYKLQPSQLHFSWALDTVGYAKRMTKALGLVQAPVGVLQMIHCDTVCPAWLVRPVGGAVPPALVLGRVDLNVKLPSVRRADVRLEVQPGNGW